MVKPAKKKKDNPHIISIGKKVRVKNYMSNITSIEGKSWHLNPAAEQDNLLVLSLNWPHALVRGTDNSGAHSSFKILMEDLEIVPESVPKEVCSTDCSQQSSKAFTVGDLREIARTEAKEQKLECKFELLAGIVLFAGGGLLIVGATHADKIVLQGLGLFLSLLAAAFVFYLAFRLLTRE